VASSTVRRIFLGERKFNDAELAPLRALVWKMVRNGQFEDVFQKVKDSLSAYSDYGGAVTRADLGGTSDRIRALRGLVKACKALNKFETIDGVAISAKATALQAESCLDDYKKLKTTGRPPKLLRGALVCELRDAFPKDANYDSKDFKTLVAEILRLVDKRPLALNSDRLDRVIAKALGKIKQ